MFRKIMKGGHAGLPFSLLVVQLRALYSTHEIKIRSMHLPIPEYLKV